MCANNCINRSKFLLPSLKEAIRIYTSPMSSVYDDSISYDPDANDDFYFTKKCDECKYLITDAYSWDFNHSICHDCSLKLFPILKNCSKCNGKGVFDYGTYLDSLSQEIRSYKERCRACRGTGKAP